MTVLVMGGNEKKENSPLFHDFLGRSSEEIDAEVGQGNLFSGSSDLGSERQGVNSSEVFHFHGGMNAISGPETSNALSGYKRSYSSSSGVGLIRDKMLPVGSDSPESSRLMKMFGKEPVNERMGRSSNDDMPFSMQPPRPAASIILHPPATSRRTRPDSLVSIWERSLPMNPGSMMNIPSHFGHGITNMDRISSSYTYKDANMGPALISQDAADEGSRTGMKGSRVLNINPSSSGVGEKNTTGMRSYDSRPATQIIETGASNMPSCQSMESSTRQMTIFYAGQAHVFDDVHPNKADIIMALAGSDGGSWLTTYSSESGVRPLGSDAKIPSVENEMRVNELPLSIPGISLASELPSLTPGIDEAGRLL